MVEEISPIKKLQLGPEQIELFYVHFETSPIFLINVSIFTLISPLFTFFYFLDGSRAKVRSLSLKSKVLSLEGL